MGLTTSVTQCVCTRSDKHGRQLGGVDNESMCSLQTLSFHCVCGGVGMYWQRVVFTPDEADEVREQTFDSRAQDENP